MERTDPVGVIKTPRSESLSSKRKVSYFEGITIWPRYSSAIDEAILAAKAGRLADAFQHKLGNRLVFGDVSSIPRGEKIPIVSGNGAGRHKSGAGPHRA